MVASRTRTRISGCCSTTSLSAIWSAVSKSSDVSGGVGFGRPEAVAPELGGRFPRRRWQRRAADGVRHCLARLVPSHERDLSELDQHTVAGGGGFVRGESRGGAGRRGGGGGGGPLWGGGVRGGGGRSGGGG